MEFTVVIKTPKGQKVDIELCDSEEEWKHMTVLHLKKKIEEREGVPVDQQRLVFMDRKLEDDRTLSGYGIQHMSTVHMKLRSGGSGCWGFQPTVWSSGEDEELVDGDCGDCGDCGDMLTCCCCC